MSSSLLFAIIRKWMMRFRFRFLRFAFCFAHSAVVRLAFRDPHRAMSGDVAQSVRANDS